MSTTIASTSPTTTAPEARTLRRAGWSLIGSLVAFLVGLTVTIVQGLLSGALTAEQEAADRLGVGVNELPPEVVAEIYGRPGWAQALLIALPFVIAPVLFVIGVRGATTPALPRHRPVALAATGLALGCAGAWTTAQVLSALLEVEQLPVQGAMPILVTLTSAFGGAALVALVVVLRARGHARRTGVVVAVLGALTVVACFTMPPFAPFLLGLVLGVPLARTRVSATM